MVSLLIASEYYIELDIVFHITPTLIYIRKFCNKDIKFKPSKVQHFDDTLMKKE